MLDNIMIVLLSICNIYAFVIIGVILYDYIEKSFFIKRKKEEVVQFKSIVYDRDNKKYIVETNLKNYIIERYEYTDRIINGIIKNFEDNVEVGDLLHISSKDGIIVSLRSEDIVFIGKGQWKANLISELMNSILVWNILGLDFIYFVGIVKGMILFVLVCVISCAFNYIYSKRMI